ncbi:MAG: hypothetical protein ACR2LV_06560 [Solirubrobacteraceae bacterium]
MPNDEAVSESTTTPMIAPMRPNATQTPTAVARRWVGKNSEKVG